MVSDMEVHMKQRCVTEFLHVEKSAPTDIHRYLLNTYRDQTVGESTGSHFGSGMFQQWQQQTERKATFQLATHICHTMKQRVSRSAHPHKLAEYNQTTAYRDEYQLQCIGNNGGNIGISQILHQVGPTITQERKENHIQVCQGLLNQYRTEGDHIITGDGTMSPL